MIGLIASRILVRNGSANGISRLLSPGPKNCDRTTRMISSCLDSGRWRSARCSSQNRGVRALAVRRELMA